MTGQNILSYQLDFKSAYLNAKIDCEVYVEQPPGFVSKAENGHNLVVKLNKSLYGLKQSGRVWHQLLHSFITNLEFEMSTSENCVFTRVQNDDIVIIITCSYKRKILRKVS